MFVVFQQPLLTFTYLYCLITMDQSAYLGVKKPLTCRDVF